MGLSRSGKVPVKFTLLNTPVNSHMNTMKIGLD
jgi:hypothetical protein